MIAGDWDTTCTYRSRVRADSRPQWVEAVVAASLAIPTDTVIARREEDGDTSGACLHELIADTGHVRRREALLLATVRRRHNRRRVTGGSEIACKVSQLVLESLATGTRGAQVEVLVGLVRPRDGTHVLGVEVTLERALSGAGSRVATARDRDVGEVFEGASDGVRLGELCIVGVDGADLDQLGRGHSLAALAGIGHVVERVEA